jgi:hypothetical protein
VGTPPEGKRFEKGKSGNPRGGSKKASLKKKLKELDATNALELLKLVMTSPLEKLEEIINDAKKDGTKQHSALVTLMASVTVRGIAKGDHNALTMLLDRAVGRVPTPMQLTSPDGSMRPTVILELPDNGFRAPTPDTEDDG